MINEELWKELFSKRVREEMKRLGMTMDELSFATGLSLGTVYNCVSKITMPSTKTVLCIAGALGVKPDQLIYFEEVYYA